MKIGLIFSIAAAVIGDFSGKYLAEYQPEKLAAAEWHFETEGKASLVLFGVLDGEEVKYAIKIPYALSILAHFNPNAEVIGLDQFAEEDLPPLYIHYLFDIMVSIGMFMVLVSLLYVVGKHGAGSLYIHGGIDGSLWRVAHSLSLPLKQAGGLQRLDVNHGFFMV